MNYDEGFNMDREDVKLVLEQAERVAEGLTSVANSIGNTVRQCQADLEIEKSILKSCDEKHEDWVYTRAVLIAENLISGARNRATELYNLTKLSPIFRNIMLEDDVSAETKLNESISDYVEVCLENDAIFVRTPMLWTRNGRSIRGMKGRPIGPDRATTFRDEILCAMRNHPKFQSYDFSKYENKIIHYLYVYEDISANKLFVADNDNHETKYIQDTITMFLPGGDTPFSCFIFSSAVQSKAIPEGTYITVTSFEKGILKHNQILGFWKEHLDRTKS